MVSKNREEYALLSDIDYYMCNKHKLPFCNPKAVFYPTNINQLCIMALFMKIETGIKRFCKQTVVLNQRLPFAKYLSSGIWLVVTNENLKFTVSCQSGQIETTELIAKSPFDICTFKAVDALKSLLKLQNMTHFNIRRKAKSTFESSSHVKVPSHLLNLKEIPMPMFMHGIRHMHKINKEQTSFWTFGNIALIVLFTVICVIIGIYMIKRYNKSSHSFCLKRTVGEHETAVTVLKLPTQDVRSNDIEESAPLHSESGSSTNKDQSFLGQTDAVLAWPKIGTTKSK